MPQLEHSHNPREIARRLHHGPRVSYLRDWVYGGIDGTVTTFAIMAGVVGASLSSGVVIILGIANLLADEGNQTVGVLFRQESYGQGLADAFKENFEALGGIVVPIYPTLPHDQIEYIVNDSGVRMLFVGDAELLATRGEHTHHPHAPLADPHDPAQGALTGEELAGQGRADARDVADRAILMADGGWAEVAPPDQLFTNPQEERTKQFLAHIL
mgnify:CR=1 FL=1